MNTEQRLQQLERQMSDIINWKSKKDLQQIEFPLDVVSKDILSKDFLRFDRRLDFTSSAGNISPNMLIKFNDTNALLSITTELKQFTVNVTTNVITLDSVSSGYSDGDQVNLYTTNLLPAPLSDASPYYVISSSGNTFKLSLTFGGAEINITDTGTGSHYALFLT